MSLILSPSIGAVKSGKCGDNITWTLDDDHHLILTGTGDMYNYIQCSSSSDIFSTSPWSWSSQVRSVTISWGITSIGNNAFLGCTNLSSIEIPNSVTRIGDVAFYTCESLTSIEIPNSVTSLGNSAFAKCSSLQKITSYAIEPPQCIYNTFDTYTKNNCILEVPDNSIIKYRTADVWEDFLNMSGVESVTKDNEISVRSENGEIIVIGAEENADMNVYSLNGVQVYKGKIKILQVPTNGVYIVNISGKAFKVSVR